MVARWRAIALIAFFYSSMSSGMVVQGLYEVTLTATGQTEQTKLKDASDGLKQVLLKITGNPDVLSNPVVQKALSSPNQYLQQFSLLGPQIRFKFNEAEVEQLLKSANLAVWGNNRPVVLLWVAMDTPAGRTLLGSENDIEVAHQLAALSREKGIPLLLPLLDLEDVTKVTVTDVWGGFTASLKEASKRYNSDTLLIGRIQKSTSNPEEWQGEWQLLIQDQLWRWEVKGASINAVMAGVVENSLPYLAKTFAVGSKITSRPLTIGIEGVQSLDDYARVQAYLQGLNAVKAVELVSVTPSGVIFKVVPYGQDGLVALKQAIRLDPQVSKLASLDTQMSQMNQVDLTFQWVR